MDAVQLEHDTAASPSDFVFNLSSGTRFSIASTPADCRVLMSVPIVFR